MEVTEVQEENHVEDEQTVTTERIVQLENEKKTIIDGYNVQRAKMRELYLQKEKELTQANDANSKLKAELDDLKNQLVATGMQLENNVEDESRKAAEIASLQQIINETVEESSSSKSIFESEMRTLRTAIKKLEDDNTELKDKLQYSPRHNAQESSSLAPSLVLSSVTKKLAKRLGADAFTTQDDDQRDETDLLKSQNTFFQLEIQALKDKLRATDKELRSCKHEGHMQDAEMQGANHSLENSTQQVETTATNTSFEAKSMLCDMCSNYEAQLVKVEKVTAGLQAKLTQAEVAVEKQKEYVLKEIGFRKDMEEKWNEKREETKTQVIELTKRTTTAEASLLELQKYFEQQTKELKVQLSQFTKDRNEVMAQIERLQEENDILVAKHSTRSHQMDSESINLPNNVEELHLLILKMRDDLFKEKIGKEIAEEKFQSVSTEMMLMKESNGKECALLRETLASRDQMVDKEVSGFKLQIRMLQQELENNEKLQRDFVHLTQNLQRELENFRVIDSAVRWQHEDDAVKCPGCRELFHVSGKKKRHCSHCIQVFCEPCLRHTVVSGPKARPYQVCDVCHTLLNKDSAPYFSKEVPQSPD